MRIHAHDEDELQSLLLYLTRTPDTVVTALSGPRARGLVPSAR